MTINMMMMLIVMVTIKKYDDESAERTNDAAGFYVDQYDDIAMMIMLMTIKHPTYILLSFNFASWFNACCTRQIKQETCQNKFIIQYKFVKY